MGWLTETMAGPYSLPSTHKTLYCGVRVHFILSSTETEWGSLFVEIVVVRSMFCSGNDGFVWSLCMHECVCMSLCTNTHGHILLKCTQHQPHRDGPICVQQDFLLLPAKQLFCLHRFWVELQALGKRMGSITWLANPIGEGCTASEEPSSSRHDPMQACSCVWSHSMAPHSWGLRQPLILNTMWEGYVSEGITLVVIATSLFIKMKILIGDHLGDST